MLWGKALKSVRTGVTDATFPLEFTHFSIFLKFVIIFTIFPSYSVHKMSRAHSVSSSWIICFILTAQQVACTLECSTSTTQASTTVFWTSGYVILPSCLLTLAHTLSHRSQIKELNQQRTSILYFTGSVFNLLCSLWGFMRMGMAARKDARHGSQRCLCLVEET